MKKINFIILSILLMMILSLHLQSHVNPSCPPGYTLETDTVYIDGCPFLVDFCLKCEPHYPGELFLRKIPQLGCEPTSVASADIPKHILNNISTYVNFFWRHCNELPPCSLGYEEIKIAYPYCWDIYHYAQDKYSYMPCDFENYCLVTSEYCIDEYGLPSQTVKSASNVGDDGIANCETKASDVTEPPLHNTSDCYHINTPCNP